MTERKARERELMIEATGDIEAADKLWRKRMVEEWDSQIKAGQV